MSKIIVTTNEELKKLLEETLDKMSSAITANILFKMGERYISANEACRLLGVTFNTFKTYVTEGTIKAHYPSALGNPKYLLSEILNFNHNEVKRSKNTIESSKRNN